MGIVFKARHLSLNRVVALKMVLAGGHIDPEGRARFKAEAEAVARLRHLHIVQVHDNGILEGKPFLVMEYCEGGSLAAALDGTPLPPERAAALVEQLAGAVAAAHEAGIIHRDLKPGNVLLQKDEGARSKDEKARGTDDSSFILHPAAFLPKIADFGLAKNIDDDSSQTRTGAILGTPSYMAPEQALGESKRVGPAADIYALGAILYQLLTGRPPFKGASSLETLEQVRTQEPVPPRQLRPKTPRDLETICLKCLHKEPARRYATATELAEDLRRFQQGEPILARPVGRLERLDKWARRRPAVAGLMALSVLLAVGGIAGILWAYSEALHERNRAVDAERKVGRERDNALKAEKIAEEERDNARNAEEIAEEQRDKALDAETRERLARQATIRKLYHSHINLAHAEWLNGDVSRAEDLLDECPPEHIDREWHYLKRLCHPEEKMLSVQNWGNDLAYSKDGKLLVAGSMSGVSVWDMDKGRTIFKPRSVPGLAPMGVALSPDGRWVAAAFGDINNYARPGKVMLWNLDNRNLQHEFVDFDAGVSGIAFSPDSKRLAAVRADKKAGQFTIWEATTGKMLKNILIPGTGKEKRIRLGVARLAFSPDGKSLAVAANPLRVVDVESGVELFNVPKASGELIAFDGPGRQLVCCSGFQVFVCDAANGEVKHQFPSTVTGYVRSLALSADGKSLIIGTGENLIRIWTLGSFDPPDILRGHRHWVTGLALQADGKTLASISADATVKFWDLTRRTQGFQTSAWSSAVVADNERDLLVAAGAGLAFRDLATEQVRKTEQLLGQTISALEPSRDGNVIALGGVKGLVVLYDLAKQRELHRLSGKHAASVARLRFDRSARQLVSASTDGTIVLWNTKTGKLMKSWQGKSGPSQALAIHPEGNVLVFASPGSGREPPLVFWDLENDKELGRSRHGVWSYDFAEDGQSFASASHQVAYLWKLSDGPFWAQAGEPKMIKAHNSMIWDLRFSPDSRRLATWGQDGTLRLWNVATGESMLRMPFGALERSRLSFSSRGNYLAAQTPGRVRVFDFRPWPGQFVAREASGLRFLALSPDQKMLAAPLLDGTLTLRNASDGALIRQLKGHTATIRRVAFSPDGKLIASASFDRTVRLWDPATGASKGVVEGHTGFVEAVLFTPDGKTVVSAGQDRRICAWDVETGKRRYSLEVYPDSIYDLTMSSDGATIAVAGKHHSVVVLETQTGKKIETLASHTNLTFCALFHPDGKTLATGSQDGTVKFWDTATWKEQRELQVDQRVLSMAFSRDGARLAIGERTGRVQLWDVAAAKSLAGYPFHTGRLDGLTFTADGQTLFTGGEDGNILRWNLTHLDGD